MSAVNKLLIKNAGAPGFIPEKPAAVRCADAFSTAQHNYFLNTKTTVFLSPARLGRKKTVFFFRQPGWDEKKRFFLSPARLGRKKNVFSFASPAGTEKNVFSFPATCGNKKSCKNHLN
ncbi:MAG: hypothetical protein LBS12_05535 [Prevotellaceae bacterium]|jgi:hypothetical protein|nr:hypothetical protein [Prevotellaceae bacterium]